MFEQPPINAESNKEQPSSGLEEILERWEIKPKTRERIKRIFLSSALLLPGCGSLSERDTYTRAMQNTEQRESVENANPYRYVEEDRVKSAPELHAFVEAAKQGIPAKTDYDRFTGESSEIPSYITALEDKLQDIPKNLDEEWSWGMKLVDGKWYPVVLNELGNVGGAFFSDNSVGEFTKALATKTEFHVWHNHNDAFIADYHKEKFGSNLDKNAIDDGYAPPSTVDFDMIDVNEQVARIGNYSTENLSYYVDSSNGVYKYGKSGFYEPVRRKLSDAIPDSEKFVQAVQHRTEEKLSDAQHTGSWQDAVDASRDAALETCEEVVSTKNDKEFCGHYFGLKHDIVLKQDDLASCYHSDNVGYHQFAKQEFEDYKEMASALGYDVEYYPFKR